MLKTVVITGASTGIGKTCALYLDQLGYQVFAGVRKLADGAILQKQAINHLQPILIDVTQDDTIKQASEIVSQKVGSAGITGLINNAGIVVAGPLEFLPTTMLRQQFEVNLFGQMAVTQAFLPLLRQGNGRIINMGSISGRVATPFLGPYAASKFALRALNDSLRVELKRWGIQVILIEPGAIATPIWEKSVHSNIQLGDTFPAQAKKLYSGVFQALPNSMKKTENRAISPQKVAITVVHALTSPHPKAQYLVGRDARLAAWMVKWLPTPLRDWLVTRRGRK